MTIDDIGSEWECDVAIMQNRPKNAETSSIRCLPLGVPHAELMASPFKIVQTSGLIVMMYEIDNTHRQIYTDGRQLPQDRNPAWLGYSVGHWEGETLVVDSAGFNDKFFIDMAKHPVSESLRIQERFRRRNFGHMDLQITIDDPKMYTQRQWKSWRRPMAVFQFAAPPITFKVTQLLLPDSDILEYFCAENEKDRSHVSP